LAEGKTFNPYSQAILDVGSGIVDAMRELGPPRARRDQIATFKRRMSDPQAMAEWEAIKELWGPAETERYMSEMSKEVERWEGVGDGDQGNG
jgi:hypothetical protein